MSALRIAKRGGERGRRAICSLGEQQSADPPDLGIDVRLGAAAERQKGGFGREGRERRRGGLAGGGRGKLHRLQKRLLPGFVVHPGERGSEDRGALVVGAGERLEDAPGAADRKS